MKDFAERSIERYRKFVNDFQLGPKGQYLLAKPINGILAQSIGVLGVVAIECFP